MTARAGVLPTIESGDDLRRWSIAAAVVVAAHAGLMGGYALFHDEELPGAPNAPAITLEFAPLAEAPPSPADLAPGPEMIEALQSQEPTPQNKPELVEPLPKIEQPADVTLPAEEPKVAEEKPKQVTKVEKPVEDKKIEEQTPAPRTTAAPQSDQRAAVTPRAPSPGSSDANSIRRWRDLVVLRLQSAKRYPATAGGAQGTAMITFTLNRNGQVLSRSLVRSSGNPALDEEALSMVVRAAPFPPFPVSMSGPSVNLPVPVRFMVR